MACSCLVCENLILAVIRNIGFSFDFLTRNLARLRSSFCFDKYVVRENHVLVKNARCSGKRAEAGSTTEEMMMMMMMMMMMDET